MKLKKSEIVALATIEHYTKYSQPNSTGEKRKSCIITNDMFKNRCLSRRDLIVKATNALREYGLINKVRSCDHYFYYSLKSAK